MSPLDYELNAVTKLSFVADAYPYRDNETIVVVLKSPLRENLPYGRSILTFSIDSFTEAAVLETYERDIVHFLAETLRTAERLLDKPVKSTSAIRHIAPLCLN